MAIKNIMLLGRENGYSTAAYNANLYFFILTQNINLQYILRAAISHPFSRSRNIWYVIFYCLSYLVLSCLRSILFAMSSQGIIINRL